MEPGLGFLGHDEEGDLDPGLQLAHVRPHLGLGHRVRGDPLGGGHADGRLALADAPGCHQACKPQVSVCSWGPEIHGCVSGLCCEETLGWDSIRSKRRNGVWGMWV